MYQRILVPVDGSPTSRHGLDEAVRLARITCASLRLVHVADMQTYATALDLYASMTTDMPAALREAGEKILAQCRERVLAEGLDVSTFLVEGFSGPVSEHVVDQARLWGADLIVVGTHGRRGVGRFLIGSDAERILRGSPVPVLLVRAPELSPGAGEALAAPAAGQAGP